MKGAIVGEGLGLQDVRKGFKLSFSHQGLVPISMKVCLQIQK
jgi:hypothetical protein